MANHREFWGHGKIVSHLNQSQKGQGIMGHNGSQKCHNKQRGGHIYVGLSCSVVEVRGVTQQVLLMWT